VGCDFVTMDPNHERRALNSLLDTVEQLCLGLAAGQMPNEEWAEMVRETLDKHRRELAGEIVAWPRPDGE
jgi:hypothetical protein